MGHLESKTKLSEAQETLRKGSSLDVVYLQKVSM